jgi:hypothetical protein
MAKPNPAKDIDTYKKTAHNNPKDAIKASPSKKKGKGKGMGGKGC